MPAWNGEQPVGEEENWIELVELDFPSHTHKKTTYFEFINAQLKIGFSYIT